MKLESGHRLGGVTMRFNPAAAAICGFVLVVTAAGGVAVAQTTDGPDDARPTLIRQGDPGRATIEDHSDDVDSDDVDADDVDSDDTAVVPRPLSDNDDDQGDD